MNVCGIKKRGTSLMFWAIFCLAVFCGCPLSAWGAQLEVTVTSPWLALLANFIGGVNVNVTSIQEWNEEGELVRRLRARSLQSLSPEALIMAFDFRDSKGLGLPEEQYKN
jgi:hypothetical protein